MSAIQNLNLRVGLLGALIQITFLWEIATLAARKEPVELSHSEWMLHKTRKYDLR
jgi:hypothetical protein